MMRSMGGSIRPIRYVDVLDAPNAESLLSEYAHECSLPAIGQPDPQRQMYDAMEQAGRLFVLGAYDDDKLVGFASFLMAALPHYGKKVATMESLFLSQEYRGSGLGMKLLVAVEQIAKDSECVAVLYSARTGSTFEKLLSMLKCYEQTNTVFCRRLQ